MSQIEIERNDSQFRFFPPPPLMPLSSDSTANSDLLSVRREDGIGKNEWEKLKRVALAHNISPLTVLLAAFDEVLSRWSAGAAVNTVLLNGPVGYVHFNGSPDYSVSPRPAIPFIFRPSRDKSWLESCRRMEVQLADSMKRDCTAVESGCGSNAEEPAESEAVAVFANGLPVLLPEYSGTQQNTSGIGLQAAGDDERKTLSFLPNARLQCYVAEREGGIQIILDMPAELSRNLDDAMLAAYIFLLNWAAESSWEQCIPDLLPSPQRLVREAVNATLVPVAERLLYQDFFHHASENPGKAALLWVENKEQHILTYGELADKVLRLAALLLQKGVKTGDAVAITLSRGPNQVLAVLAVLAAGAVYVPIGINQPPSRRERICRLGGIRHLITDQAGNSLLLLAEAIKVILIEEAEQTLPLPLPVAVSSDSLAYVIFTSGSTGDPKGVEITHRAAYNTIADINTRFSLTETDRVLTVSALDFDLSVYDIFGLLSAGGGIVLLDEGNTREAPAWLELIRTLQVTVWNSVPALFDMLLTAVDNDAVLASLRLVLVSGDWVGLDLHDRLRAKNRECRLVALGGATEASIWSNYFEINYVDSSWNSIPYGKPLRNQYFRIVDRLGRDCPDMVAGELWIGGAGVAQGYRGNPVLTAASFIDAGDCRWYRTGDLGRYWSDGVIEFLGRADHQIKLRGYRIELGEVEAVLRQYPGVGQAVAAIVASSGAKQLGAVVVAGSAPLPVQADLPEPRSCAAHSYRQISRELQAKIAEALIAEILGLAELRDATSLKIGHELRLVPEYQPLVQMWLKWLEQRNVIKVNNGVLRAGDRFGEVLAYAGAIKQPAATCSSVMEDGSLTAAIEQRLFQRRDDYRSILSGDLAAEILLDDELLSPENLSSRDYGTNLGIRLIAGRLKKMTKSIGKPVDVALLGGRSGLLAARLLAMLAPEDIRLTLFDPAPSMVAAAEQRLSVLRHSVGCHILPENFVPEQFRYSFDAVLAINSLHRYHDPCQGVAVAALLVRGGGKIFALEHCELTPLAAVTAAVLDRGFAAFDHERRQAYSPMLPALQWLNLLSKAGFGKANVVSLKNSFSEFIEAECPAARQNLEPARILEFAAKYLPVHMLPERVEVLPWLPLSANGKVDRKAVAAVFGAGAVADDDEQPQAGMEQEIAGMWHKLLKISSIGRNQGFFTSGGDSLLATRFLAEVKEKFGLELSLRQMFESPSLWQVAAILENKLTEMKQDMVFMEEGEI
ncbi:amino acid adenylation domain-containing protein [Sporomusa sphaeroides]|uniref:Anguibactin system regulator n=1 Tax=Sporomusa sphaeroides DSM 2875 TaxID=1337886 RepID=A0ABP2C9V1_9FIRM|nr:amino acid adenylation domain-containing protein [Sporomusa sphaeroides]OLS57252.1 anguibactin system regulator [Sporomusa sphaeroides DSM 2875]CVK20154.1 Anguibactin system regulator [Sporomusa sphaeroides DSM 2875]